MKIHRGDEEDGRSIAVRFRCKNRNVARCEIELLGRQLLPPGYVLDEEHIISGRRDDPKRRPGRKVNVTIILFQNDTRHPPVKFDDLERILKVLDTV